MPFWKSARRPADVITAEQLAAYGRYEFLGAGQSGIEDGYPLIVDLASRIYTGDPAAHAEVNGELRRHAERGEWEKVGAWKFAAAYLGREQDVADLIDGGLLALARMRVANLGFVLPFGDMPRYEELTGGPVPNNKFFGPPVFDSDYGPSRQYYVDNAVSALDGRSATRLSHHPGVSVPDPREAAECLHHFGLLIYLGPLAVSPNDKIEAIVLWPAVRDASAADHAVFIQQVAAELLADDPEVGGGFAPIGAARFAEEYLLPEVLNTEDYRRLLDRGLRNLIDAGDPGLLDPDLLTVRQQDRLTEIRGRP
jgi:hypothetical protein